MINPATKYTVLFTVLLWAVGLPAGPAAETGPPAYLEPGTPAVGGIRHLCLIYHGGKARVLWTKDAILPYVARVDDKGAPTDWFFDSFLFIEFAADDGAWLIHYREGAPQPTAADWEWLADAWFRPDTGLAGLDRAVGTAGQTLGQPGHKVKVVITMPMPLSQIKAFGPLPGDRDPLDFGKEDDRRHALGWYLDQVQRRWRAAQYQHLELAGFYWLAETIPPPDHDLVRWTARRLHEQHSRLYWIPYLGSQGLRIWRGLGIDAAMLQPGLFFADNYDPTRVVGAGKLARQIGCGIEVEFDAQALTSPDYQQRLWAYLDAGARDGWMTNALVAYYEGGDAIRRFVDSPGLGRELYEAVYRFVKGTYAVSGKADLRVPAHDNRANLALASNGARIHGGIPSPNDPGLAPERIIDGEVDAYGGMDGFGYFAWPGSFTIELARTATVSRTETGLWDRDRRFFRYRIDTSLDNAHWEPAVDKSAGEWRSWQVDRFSPRPAKYIRFTGLYDSLNNLFQVVEFEVYPESPTSAPVAPVPPTPRPP